MSELVHYLSIIPFVFTCSPVAAIGWLLYAAAKTPGEMVAFSGPTWNIHAAPFPTTKLSLVPQQFRSQRVLNKAAIGDDWNFRRRSQAFWLRG